MFITSPTWGDPYYDEYCKLYGDFCNMEHEKIECNSFELSKYGEIKIQNEREKKLERICK